MEQDINQENKQINKETPEVSTKKSDSLQQEDEQNISDKISENRNVGGLTERDDAPGSGIDTDSTEQTMGNP
jgi:hypothetical protein